MPKSKRPKTQLAEKLIEYRQEFGFTQQKVSDILGIKRSTYGYYEIDVCPPIAILKKLSNMYNISLDTLTGEYPLVEPVGPEILKVGQPESEYVTAITQKNADESELLMLYRILPAELKSQVKEIVKGFADKLD
ncbi:MAG: helix-turn-helix transcriptional regulator [Clostridia bacterium]|nr:helix-turn-helix transcriptional regulator [Clostridia bacterium]